MATNEEELQQTLDGVGPNGDSLREGAVVGDYRIEALIGEGSFGKVYRAVHTVIDKLVALKVLGREVSEKPDVVGRFLDEARSVNRIRHRNIVDIFDFGHLDDGRQYYAMELLEGVTLADYLEQHGRVSLQDSQPILRGLARAIDAAHAAEIAHRDLKPENVFLTFDEDGEPFPKVLDFGIAKLFDETQRSQKTRTGAIVGTPMYMSPEQCEGKSVDTRTDVYAFGVIIHEMLTAEMPFEADTMMALMFKHVNAPAPPMSSVCPDIPGALDGPVLRMLAKAPEERPASLPEALSELMDAATASGMEVRPFTAKRSLSGERSSQRSYRSSGDQSLAEAKTLQASSVDGGSGTLDTVAGELAPPRSSRGAWFVVAAMAAVVVLAVLYMRTEAEPPPTAATQSAAPVTAVSAEPSAPTSAAVAEAPSAASSAPAAATEVRITIKSPVAGAHVLVDGKRVAGVGETFTLPHGSHPTEVTVRKSGFKPATVQVVPDSDREIDVALVRLGAPGEKLPEQLASPWD